MHLLWVYNLQADFLVGLLFGEEAGSEELLLGWRDEDTACGVFRASAAMDTDAGSAGDLADKRQESLEARRHRDLNAIDEGRDQFVEVLEGWADGSEVLDLLALRTREAVLYLAEGASYPLAIGGFPN